MLALGQTFFKSADVSVERTGGQLFDWWAVMGSKCFFSEPPHRMVYALDMYIHT